MKFTVDEFLPKLTLPADKKWKEGVWDIEPFKKGNVSLVFFAPRGIDYQTSHDEDEFYFAMQYLGYTLDDGVHEEAFKLVDYDKTGSIDWPEFRELFVQNCDVRKELEDRNVELATIVPKRTMQKQLRSILLDEEVRERRAIADAQRQKLWMFLVRDKKRFIQEAQFRSYRELRTALDAAGHVYVFGKGTNNQFDDLPAEEIKTSKFKFENFDRLSELWTDRVQPLQLINKYKSERRKQQHAV